MRTLGIILVALGIFALIYTGFTFKTKEKVADVGPIEINKNKKHSVDWSPYAGGAMLVAGLVLILAARNKR